jgi:hypothetical protein
MKGMSLADKYKEDYDAAQNHRQKILAEREKLIDAQVKTYIDDTIKLLQEAMKDNLNEIRISTDSSHVFNPIITVKYHFGHIVVASEVISRYIELLREYISQPQIGFTLVKNYMSGSYCMLILSPLWYQLID